MSKVKLIVRTHKGLDEGRVIDLNLKVSDNEQLIGVIRTDFDEEPDGSVQASDDLTPIIGYERINDLVGKLLTMIDATFVDKTQRQAMKDLYKQIAWDWYDHQRAPLREPWDADRQKN